MLLFIVTIEYSEEVCVENMTYHFLYQIQQVEQEKSSVQEAMTELGKVGLFCLNHPLNS